MIAFQVELNGRGLCAAGLGEEGVVGAHVSWVMRPVHDRDAGEPGGDRLREELSLTVGGFVHDSDGAHVHLEWVGQPLVAGDEVRIRVLEAGGADPPRTRRRHEPESVERQKRQYYEQLKREYGE